jgi:putative hydrolase of the HAD superfamily
VFGDGIDAVVFDAGGVLLLPDVAVVRGGLREYGMQPTDDDFHRVHYTLNSWIDTVAELDWHEVDRRAAASLGVPDEHIDAGGAVMRHAYTGAPWVPIEGAAETLRAIAGRGYLLAIVSNAHGTMEEQLASHEICSTRGHPAARVEIVVDSAVVGVEKPDSRIFGYALDALGVPAGRCMYVGDTVRFDVNGAPRRRARSGSRRSLRYVRRG